MPALTVFALVGFLAGLWIPVFSAAAWWPLTLQLLSPLAWWLGGHRLLVAVAAFVLASLHGHWYLENRLPASLVQQDIRVKGVVVSLPEQTEFASGFLFRLLPENSTPWLPQQVYLTVYNKDLQPQAGEVWQFRVRMKQALANVNSGAFDQEVRNLVQGVHARGYVRNSALNRRLAATGSGTIILRWRDRLRTRLAEKLPGNPVLPLITGISIGAREAIDSGTWRTLRDTGTGHLVAISGLHVGLIALAGWWPGKFCGWLLCLRGLIAGPLVVARLSSLGCALVYALLAGLSIPTFRAILMVATLLALATMQRRSAPAGVLALALLLVLLFEPLAVLSAGFWLSFLAVGLLFACLRPATGPAVQRHSGLPALANLLGTSLWRMWQVQLVLGLGLLLPSLLFFTQVSLIAPLANLAAVPLFSFVILPCTLAGLLLSGLPGGVDVLLLQAAAAVLEALVVWLGWLAALTGATWQPGYLGTLAGVFMFAGLCCLLLPRPLPTRMPGLALLLAAVLCAGRPQPERLRVRVLDVGQGLAVLVQTREHNLLYDTGAAWRGGDSGAAVIVPALRAMGVAGLNLVVISHDDNDHSGGAGSILQTLPVTTLLGSGERYQEDSRWLKCRRGTRWRWDGVEFAILHPDRRSGWSDNNASCVLLITSDNSSVLLPGDIEKAAEKVLLNSLQEQSVDLVLGPHHGSRTSSGTQFISALGADRVIFSAGYANRWNFPDPEVVKRWRTHNACVYTTAQSGALDFVADNAGGFSLQARDRFSLKRPWPLRVHAGHDCAGTTNGTGGGV